VATGSVLETSDFRTLYWWPVRIAFRGGLPLWLTLVVCAGGVTAAALCLVRAYRVARSRLLHAEPVDVVAPQPA
jgi:hypothetical protein